MGLKSGSRDAGLDDSDEEESAEPEDPPQANESQVQTESASTSSEETGPGETDPEEKVVERDSSQTSKSPTKNQQTSEPKSTAGQQTMSSIPYKLRRDKVNEGREQVHTSSERRSSRPKTNSRIRSKISSAKTSTSPTTGRLQWSSRNGIRSSSLKCCENGDTILTRCESITSV